MRSAVRPVPRPALAVLGLLITFALIAGPLAPGATAADDTAHASGVVTDLAGAPLAGITVSAHSAVAHGVVASASTDAAGRYDLTVPDGDYHFEVQDPAEAFFPLWLEAAALSEPATTVSLTGEHTLPTARMWPAEISGTVVRPTGEPFGSTKVELRDSRDYLVREVVTAADGSFSFASVARGEYRLVVREVDLGNRDNAPTSLQVTADHGRPTTGLEVTKTPATAVAGRVVGSDGQPWPGVNVEAIWEGVDGPATAYTSTDLQGRYALPVPAGDVSVRFWAEGAATTYYGGISLGTADKVTVAPGAREVLADQVLEAPATVTGRVAMADGTAPSSVAVAAYSTGDPTHAVASTSADTDGSYRLTQLPAGDYRLVFRPSGNFLTVWSGGAERFDAATVVHVDAGGTVSAAEVTLPVGGRLVGEAVDVQGAPVTSAGVVLTEVGGAERRFTGRVTQGDITVEALPTAEYTVHFPRSDTYAEHTLPGPVRVTAGETATTAVTLTRRLRCTSAPRLNNDVVVGEAGRAVLGEQLSIVLPGWEVAPGTTSIQWYRGEAPITGATGFTYTPVVADVGQTISVAVRGTKQGYAEETCTSTPTDPVARLMTLTSPVRIEGGSTPGDQLTATGHAWSVTPDRVDYQWFRGDEPVAGADTATYEFTQADLDRTLRVRVTAHKDDYLPVTTEDDRYTYANVNDPEEQPGAPRGRRLVGSTLRAPEVWWMQGAQDETYQWLRDGVPIQGATARSHQLKAADLGRRISVEIVPVNTSFVPGRAVSAATSAVKSPAVLTLSGKSPRRGVVKLVATLTTRAGAVPTGCVALRAPDGRKRCAALESGRATYTFKKLASGRHRFKAGYAGSTLVAGAKDAYVLRVR